MKSVFVGQLEVTSNCDLVEIFHREPVMNEATHTHKGTFESKPHWTPMTPANARRLAKALEEVAGQLEAADAAKIAAPVSLQP